MVNDITGVILAGGKSTRMGQTKALLPYKGKTIIEHIIDELKPYCKYIIINANTPEHYAFLKLPIVADRIPNCGPLAGIETALFTVNTSHCFFVPCDLPFFSGRIIPLLAKEIVDADICVPFLNGFYEPLVSLYAKSALTSVSKCINSQKYKVTNVFEDLKVKIVQEGLIKRHGLENIFVNINDTEEYNKILRGNNND